MDKSTQQDTLAYPVTSCRDRGADDGWWWRLRCPGAQHVFVIEMGVTRPDSGGGACAVLVPNTCIVPKCTYPLLPSQDGASAPTQHPNSPRPYVAHERE